MQLDNKCRQVFWPQSDPTTHSPPGGAGGIFCLFECVFQLDQLYTHALTHVDESRVLTASSWGHRAIAYVVAACCSGLGPHQCLQSKMGRGVCLHSAFSRASGGDRWLSRLGTAAVLGCSCSLDSSCLTPVGLPQFGHLSVPEYLIRVPGYHLGFPPPAVSGHQRGHASAGTGLSARAR